MSITSPAAMSQYGLYGAGGDGLSSGLLNPHVCCSPPVSEPLFCDDELNSYRISEKPCGPGLLVDLVPQFVAANSPAGARIMIGWMSSASMASFISRASIFLPRYSGVR